MYCRYGIEMIRSFSALVSRKTKDSPLSVRGMFAATDRRWLARLRIVILLAMMAMMMRMMMLMLL